MAKVLQISRQMCYDWTFIIHLIRYKHDKNGKMIKYKNMSQSVIHGM